MVCIALVAGEASGDLLGADLIRSLKQVYPDAKFIGIAGPEMKKQGCESLYPMESLSIMGLVEVLSHLPKLLKMRKTLFTQILAKNPDVFIGIDAPDFNLGLERRLKEAGIKTIHYVSPSVWAWRQWRVKKMARSIDLMLTLFPFEVDFYKTNNVVARFVGHPLASMIPVKPDIISARDQLQINHDANLIALLPGSRRSEVKRLAPVFVDTAIECFRRDNQLEFIVPFATDATRNIFQQVLDEKKASLPIKLVSGKSRMVMQAADYVLLASGTAALEAMLLKKPMVVAYKMNGLTLWLLRKLKILKVSLYSLPNILADKQLVEEFIQNDATTANLSNALMKLVDSRGNDELITCYRDIHEQLRQTEDKQAGKVIAEFITKGQVI